MKKKKTSKGPILYSCVKKAVNYNIEGFLFQYQTVLKNSGMVTEHPQTRPKIYANILTGHSSKAAPQESSSSKEILKTAIYRYLSHMMMSGN